MLVMAYVHALAPSRGFIILLSTVPWIYAAISIEWWGLVEISVCDGRKPRGT